MAALPDRLREERSPRWHGQRGPFRRAFLHQIAGEIGQPDFPTPPHVAQAGVDVALLRAQKMLEKLQLEGDMQIGVNIVKRAIEEPLRQIAANGGFEGSVVLNRVKEGKGSFGWNAATAEYEDLVKAGVIDPTKVVRTALQALDNKRKFAGGMAEAFARHDENQLRPVVGVVIGHAVRLDQWAAGGLRGRSP